MSCYQLQYFYEQLQNQALQNHAQTFAGYALNGNLRIGWMWPKEQKPSCLPESWHGA